MSTNWQPISFKATTIGDAWFQALYLVWNHGRHYKITRGSYEGTHRLEFDFVSGFINHPHIRPLTPIMPEAISVPAPTSEHEIDQYFANYLMDPNLAPEEEYRYSSWINGDVQAFRRGIHGGLATLEYLLEQYDPSDPELRFIHRYTRMLTYAASKNLSSKITPIEWVIKHFKEAGHGTNHCYLTVGNPDSNFAYDRPYSTEAERGTSPCLRGLDFKIVGGELLTHAYFRSWDLFSGFCTNLGGITLLNEYVAASLDISPGPIAFTSKGLHVYDFALEPLKTLLRQDGPLGELPS